MIHTGLDSVVATIDVGTRPRGVVVSADGKQIYVALSGSPKCPPAMPDEECEKLQADKSKDGIAVVNAATRKVERILPGGSDPETFALSADGSKLYVSNEDAGLAAIVDIASGQVIDTVRVGKEPEGVQVQPDGQRVVDHRRDRPRRHRARCDDLQGGRPRAGRRTPPRHRASPPTARRRS